MDAFFVSVEEVRDPSLRGKPVIVGGDPDGRGVVAAASYAARAYGIRSAMPLARAKRLCPHAIFLRGAHGLYGEFSRRIFSVLRTYSPQVEPMSLDEAYVDLTGCHRLHGPVLKAAESIRESIFKEVGIRASIGIAANKLLAKIASDFAKPNGLLFIAPGKERRFLAPLPVRRLPGVGPKGGAELERMGVRTVGDLAGLPLELLQTVYGKWGGALYCKSRGICESPVRGEEEDSKSIGRETTLETDSIDPAHLLATLNRLVEKAAAQLRESGLFARSVTLKLRFSDFTLRTRAHTFSEPVCEDHRIYRAAAALFQKEFTRRTRVRLIGVSLSGLGREHCFQADLFESVGSRQWDRLYSGIDRIREKFGFGSIRRGTSALGE